MYFMFLSPQLAEIDTLKTKMSQHADILAKINEIGTKRDAAQKDYDNISPEDIAKLAKIIPTTFDGVTFANDISALASKNSLKIGDFKSEVAQTAPRDPNSEVTVEAKPYRTVVTTLHVEGSYEHFIAFLKDIESSLHLVDVNSISINQAGEISKGGEVNLGYEMQISSYSLQ